MHSPSLWTHLLTNTAASQTVTSLLVNTVHCLHMQNYIQHVHLQFSYSKCATKTIQHPTSHNISQHLYLHIVIQHLYLQHSYSTQHS